MPASIKAVNVVFWAPGFLAALHQYGTQHAAHFSELELALTRSDNSQSASPFGGYLSLHGKTQAQLAALADGIHCEGTILRADPVKLVPDVDRLICQPVDNKAFDNEYLQQLLDAFNTLFVDDGLQLQMSATHRWYLCLNEDAGVSFTDLRDVLHNNIDTCLPTGNRAAHWRKVLNETQMLFHQINQQQGMTKAIINSIWPWEGKGSAIDAELQQCQVMSADPAMHGAAKLANNRFLPMANEWQDVTPQDLDDTLFIDLADIAAKPLLDDWLQPAINALKVGELASLLLLDNDKQFLMNRKITSRWWRRHQTLQTLAQ